MIFPKTRNAKHFKNWSRKGTCPACGVGTGSKHQEGCAVQAELLRRLATKKTNIYLEITDEDREELARLIKEGFTSGRLDNGEGKHISWSIYLDVWED